MDLLEAVARWRTCEWGKQDNCLGENKCINYMYVDPRKVKKGPGTTGQRTLCNLLDDINEQVMEKTNKN